MSSATVLPEPLETRVQNRRRAILLVFCCTLIGAAAQIFIKMGAGHTQAGFIGAIVGMLTNPPLFFGYALYGINTILLVIALRDGELSLLYPIIALTYVWVSLLSVGIFHERMNLYKSIGLALIVVGVAVSGRGTRR